MCPLRLIGEFMKPNKMDRASLKLVGEIMIQLFTLWMDVYSLKFIGEPMIQVYSFTLCTLIMMLSQRIFFAQGLWRGLPQRTSSTPLMEYLRDSLDTGQIEDGFSNSKSITQYRGRGSYSLPDPEQHESSYNLLTQWDPGKKLLQLPLFRKESTSELTSKTKESDRTFTIKLGLSQSLMVQEGTHNPNVT